MLVQAVDSVLGQQAGPPEIIIVDDGSTDDTVAAITAHFPEVRMIECSGLGPGLARNKGVSEASGDILMFLDSDDLWFPHHIQALIEVISKGFQVAYGSTRTVDEINGGEFMIPAEHEQAEGDCFRHLLRWCFLVPSATAITRQAFDAAGGFGDEHCGEDWTFFLRLAALFPFGFAAGPPITLRRLHARSLCCLSGNNKILQLIRRIIRVLKEESRANFNDIAHFMRMEQFVIQRGKQWSTVQDWYLAMREEGII